MKIESFIEPNYLPQKTWIETEKGWFLGACFRGEEYCNSEGVANLLYGTQSVDEAVSIISELNGSFAIAMWVQDCVLLAVDRERTVPIFYEKAEDVIRIYNHISIDVIKKNGVNQTALEELYNALFVSGEKTVANNIFSVMAGGYIVFDSIGKHDHYYFAFNFPKMKSFEKHILFTQIDDTFRACIHRLITYLNGRCAVIPLSGGHDSRLIVYYLLELGYTNIITYTYGPQGNYEANTSKQVADYLGVCWYNVEYHSDKLRALFDSNYHKLLDYYFNGVSSVCIQDWYAVDYLVKKDLIPKDSVFVPGHSFDAIAGSFILPQYVQNKQISVEQLTKDIIKKHYSEGRRDFKPNSYAYYENLIITMLGIKKTEMMEADEAFDFYQTYNTRERQAKFTCAQTRIYNYYGFDWYMPLWDAELIAFWETIPLLNKYNRALFFEFTMNKYPDLMRAAPVENEKSKNVENRKVSFSGRLIRKVDQLIHLVDYHYCMGYFHRSYVYKCYLKSGILSINYINNCKIISEIRRRMK